MPDNWFTIAELEKQLAEQRAQIAAKDAALERRRLDIDHLDVKLADALDQIAALKEQLAKKSHIP